MVEPQKTVENNPTPKTSVESFIENPAKFPAANAHRLVLEISELSKLSDEPQLLNLREAAKVAIQKAQDSRDWAKRSLDTEMAKPKDEVNDDAVNNLDNMVFQNDERATTFLGVQLAITERLAVLEDGRELNAEEVVLKIAEIANGGDVKKAAELLRRFIRQEAGLNATQPRAEATGTTGAAAPTENTTTIDAEASAESEDTKKDADKVYTDAVAIIEGYQSKPEDGDVHSRVSRGKLWISINKLGGSFGKKIFVGSIIETARMITELNEQKNKFEKFKPLITVLEASKITKSIVEILNTVPHKADGEIDADKMAKDKDLTELVKMLKVQLIFMADLRLIHLPSWITPEDQTALQYETAPLEKFARSNNQLVREYFSTDMLMAALKERTTGVVIEAPPKPPAPTPPPAGTPRPPGDATPPPVEATPAGENVKVTLNTFAIADELEIPDAKNRTPKGEAESGEFLVTNGLTARTDKFFNQAELQAFVLSLDRVPGRNEDEKALKRKEAIKAEGRSLILPALVALERAKTDQEKPNFDVAKTEVLITQLLEKYGK